jgi:polar amino acid transport system permease protein
VPELLYVSNQIWSDNINTFEMMNVLMVVYLLLVGLVAFAMYRWERALRLPGVGASAR